MGLESWEARTKAFAIAAIRIAGALDEIRSLRDALRRLTRSAGSVAANHRGMRRARSPAEFTAKLQIVNEEIDESVLWLEVVSELAPERAVGVKPVLQEALELRAMFARARNRCLIHPACASPGARLS
jgi:four helix bundle protein